MNPASYKQFHTRTRPGDVLYSVKNGDLPPPDDLIPGEGLPAFRSSLMAQQALVQAGMPYPIGRFRVSDEAKLALHDTQQFVAEDGARYRSTGYHLVELPSGEVRIIDRNALESLPPNPIGVNLAQQATGLPSPIFQKGHPDWARSVRSHHAKYAHGHTDPESLSDDEYDSWHTDHHQRFRERLTHAPHARGILALRKSAEVVEAGPLRKALGAAKLVFVRHAESV